jgi:hypothetical protein
VSQVLAVVSITLINSTLVTLTGKLTDFEKHHTRSKMARSMARQLFLTQVGRLLPPPPSSR